MKEFYCTITMDGGNKKPANVCFRVHAERYEDAAALLADWLGEELWHELQPILDDKAEPDWKTVALCIDVKSDLSV